MQNAIKLSLAALLAISLAGCGGGGNSSTDRDGEVTACSNSAAALPDKCVSSLANIELKLVQNGTFEMGTDSTDTVSYYQVNRANPKHNVTISKPYYLGIYEVTQEQWLSVNSTNPSENEGWSSEIANGADMSQHPVDNVTILDIIGFIKALNDNEPNITINGEQYVYDLPSEAEFEYAARAGTTTMRFFCADNSSDCETIADEYAWLGRNSNQRHQIVGTKKPNPWGFYDIVGNVQEYVLDTGDPSNSCKYLHENITDPLCYDDGSGQFLLRGDTCKDPFTSVYSTTRTFWAIAPGSSNGFRLALVAKSVRNNMTKYVNGTIIP